MRFLYLFIGISLGSLITTFFSMPLMVDKPKIVEKLEFIDRIVVKYKTVVKKVYVTIPSESCGIEQPMVVFPKKNWEVSVYGGYGPNGLKVSTKNDEISVSQNYDLIFGVGLKRTIKDSVNLHVIGISNKAGLMGVGYDF